MKNSDDSEIGGDLVAMGMWSPASDVCTSPGGEHGNDSGMYVRNVESAHGSPSAKR